MKSTLLASFLFTLPVAAAPTTFVESYNGTATWQLGINDTIETSGGHPGAWLHNAQLDAGVPQPAYTGPMPSPFFGDYRAAGVTSLGIDVNILGASMGVGHTRTMALVLGSDMGTPDDPFDDCQAFYAGHEPLPQPGGGWRSFEFRVPASSTRLPAGWQLDGACGGLSPDDAWNAIITHVTRVGFPFAPPMTMWFYQEWDLGLDNVRITFGG